MHLNVFVQIRSLSETEVAARDRASVGSFVCMDSKVIEEVVPFSKVLSTVVMVAFKNLYISLGFGVFETKDSESFSSWNVFLDLN